MWWWVAPRGKSLSWWARKVHVGVDWTLERGGEAQAVFSVGYAGDVLRGGNSLPCLMLMALGGNVTREHACGLKYLRSAPARQAHDSGLQA